MLFMAVVATNRVLPHAGDATHLVDGVLERKQLSTHGFEIAAHILGRVLLSQMSLQQRSVDMPAQLVHRLAKLSDFLLEHVDLCVQARCRIGGCAASSS